MKNIAERTSELIVRSYEEYRPQLCRYIRFRINDGDDAEDLAQDVFLRLMDYKPMLCEETVKDFIFTIARNLVNDYLRRYYKRQEITSYMYDTMPASTDETESGVIAADLARCERAGMRLLPPQRGRIYRMSRYEDKSAADIAEELCLSVRTVENQLFLSRREMRDYMRRRIG